MTRIRTGRRRQYGEGGRRRQCEAKDKELCGREREREGVMTAGRIGAADTEGVGAKTEEHEYI